MVVSFSHSVTFPDPMLYKLPAVSPNTLAMAAGWNLPFLSIPSKVSNQDLKPDMVAATPEI